MRCMVLKDKPTLKFLSIGAGAVFEVVDEVGKLLKRDVEKHGRLVCIFAGLLSGLLAQYVTGMWIK